ncbi:hypothetical protein FB45DRAFT_444454 [Roridomyces roridus]|uniref:Uncharacterized protein n=1 Tax=Roridomyces roridus TaxID=1738132 RepID=A0AAD7FSR3_9AGAR|nr:hypothetical protein FB45DRAFT_444454 [Roridomyces roridus]
MQCGEANGGWGTVSNVTVSVPNDLGGVYITLQQGDFSVELLPTLPLLPNSHLFGVLTWTERRVIQAMWWGHTQSWLVYTPTITGLQQNVSAAAIQSNTSQLTLVQLITRPIQLLQDTSVASPLSGISTFGGFWTFVNGTFALFFGANIIYFAFGRRPLSALGVVPIFQRRALVQQWHKDFPALHSEGGFPGSEEAGIVAFMRERLVDLGERPPEVAVHSIETSDTASEIEKGFEETTLIGLGTKDSGSR